MYHREGPEGLRWELEKRVWVTGTVNLRNEKWDLDWDSGNKIKLGHGI